ncbi:unknown protein [Seminavis robusta]|uniref:BACK domain-containing protein n=1 Tax=Seminavis robusta TaxID=568900 RepID=A0A9N8F306_9STRA|nr:unknown protein [Seminavis robusta]|eukprot:Sro2528_g330350.1 n/a (388) ;mRNA; f:6115-7278
MQEIVEYIHTDTCASLNVKKRKACEENKAKQWEAQKELAKKLVALSAAAMYYNLPSLVKEIEKSISKVVKQFPSLPLIVLATCHKEGPSVPPALLELAWSLVRSSRKALADTKAIACVDAALVEQILTDDQMSMNEYGLFLFLTQWVQINPKDREELAKKLGSNLQLEKINPVDLSTSVASSGLFMADEINEAYKKQAIAAQQAHRWSFQAARGSRVWKKTLTTETGSGKPDVNTDILNIAPIKERIHEWTAKLLLDDGVGTNASAAFGIVCTETFVEDDFLLGRQAGGWGFDDLGSSCSEGQYTLEDMRSICTDEEVNLTLNLSPSEKGNGTLIISFELQGDNRSYEIANNLHEHLKSHPGGFLPAVSTYHGACIEFVRMTTIQKG